MCTVTFIPQQGQDFILSSNRDEQASRSPQGLSRIDQFQKELLFPRDTEAGGTWIAASNKDQVVCLLNGAFELHHRQPPYRKSRGIMVLEFFEHDYAEGFLSDYSLDNMEPFTFVIYDQGRLFELRWDGVQKHIKKLSPQELHIWSSATLYDQKTQQKRVEWFENWKAKNPNHTLEAILDFHHNAGDGDPWNDIVMNRLGIVQTVSVTNISRTKEAIDIQYHEIVKDTIVKSKILLSGEVVESTKI